MRLSILRAVIGIFFLCLTVPVAAHSQGDEIVFNGKADVNISETVFQEPSIQFPAGVRPTVDFSLTARTEAFSSHRFQLDSVNLFSLIFFHSTQREILLVELFNSRPVSTVDLPVFLLRLLI